MLESPLLAQTKGFMGGRWTGAADGATLTVTNPATGEALAQVSAMGRADAERAIQSAHDALATPSTLAQRQQWLERIADALQDERRELGRILSLEHGKPWAEAQGEVDYAAGFFRFCASHIDALEPRTLSEQPRNCRWTVHHRPAGVAALITPWNFPIGMIAKKLSAALAAGCPSVIKPAAQTPLTMIALFSLLERELDLPAGMVNLVIGPAAPIGEAFCQHPDVAVISFTGSTAVGQLLMRECADQVKRLSLELGGNAPFIVFEDADLESAADHLVANKFRGGGQTCVCANRILVQASVMDRFSTLLADRVRQLQAGDGMDPDTDLGPLINRAGHDKVRRHLLDALDQGATLVHGQDPGAQLEDWGAFFPPVVIRDVTPTMACSREETFGPLVPLMPFQDEDAALALANDTPYGLAAYLFTADRERADRCIAALRFGHVGHNTGTGPTPEAPFGGMKLSGFGREGGLEGLFEFVEVQTLARAT